MLEGPNYRFFNLLGESAAVDQAVVGAYKAQIPDLIGRYTDDDVYNLDEFGLFYKMMPDQTLAFKGNKCHGGKKSKVLKRSPLTFVTRGPANPPIINQVRGRGVGPVIIND